MESENDFEEICSEMRKNEKKKKSKLFSSLSQLKRKEKLPKLKKKKIRIHNMDEEEP